jgi:DNA-binding CsgD family transcriptional regulator
VAPWTFVGRTEEVRRLTEAATGATGRGLIIGGASGIGKSRLLRSVTEALDPARYPLVPVTGTAATATLPLASLAPALPGDIVVSSQNGAGPNAVASHAGLVRWALDAVYRLGGGRTVVLAVDDAHLLDPLSAALVHHLARTRQATVIGTIRTGVPAPQPVRSLWIDDLVDRVDLGPMTADDTVDLLQVVLGGPVELGSAGRLWRLSSGNTLLLRELVTAALTSADLAEAYGVWRWTGRFPLTPTLTDVVDHRIGPLEPAVRDVLELVAFGEPLGLPLLVKATDGAAAEQAEERGLIAVTREDRRTTVRLADPLHAEVVRKRCPLTRARRLRADLAHLIEATGARRHDDMLRVAAWRVDSDTASDPRHLLRAARAAFLQRRLPLAARLSRAALADGGRFEATEVLATVLFLTGRPADALAALDAPTGSADRYRLRRLCLRSVVAYWGCFDATAPDALADAGRAHVRPIEQSWIRALESLMRLHHGEPRAARRLAGEVLDEPASGPGPRAVARTALAHLLAAGGAPARSRAMGAALTPTPAGWRTLTPYLRLATDLANGTALAIAGDVAGIDELTATDDTDGCAVRSGYRAMLAAQAARLRGQLPAAGRLAAEACALLSGGRAFAGLAHAERAHVAALCGDAERARAALADADAARMPTMAVLDPWFEHARAWSVVAAGDQAGGVAVLRRLASRLADDGFHGHELLAQLDLVRLGAASEVVRRVQWLAAYSDNPLAETVTWYTDAMARRDGPALLTAVDRFKGLGMTLYAAEAAAAAVSLLRAARSSFAAGAAEELASLLASCPAARTPALRVKQPALTKREREVAVLAARGVASKEIADQLFLSSRTVDNHLMRVYAKLGVSGRTELATALRALPDLLVSEG